MCHVPPDPEALFAAVSLELWAPSSKTPENVTCHVECNLQGREVSDEVNTLRGSWVVMTGGISRVPILTTQTRGLLTPLIATHEPPSRGVGFRTSGFRV